MNKTKPKLFDLSNIEDKKIISDTCHKCIDVIYKGCNNDIKLMAMTLVMLNDSFKDATGIDTRKYVIIEKNLKVIK